MDGAKNDALRSEGCHHPYVSQAEALAAIAVVPHGGHRAALLHAQMLLPISAAAKGVLWTVLFGLAKTCQYGGLTILGVEGYKRLKDKFRKNKD